ncbi:MAG: rane protein of unknown function [Candidatus Saccharibacteria bacterium]|nr:rane protein of unknown function [Candidatus Saccharibacteria bacterium]
MWEAITSHPRGRLSTRKYLSFATAFLVVCFAYIFATAPTTHAADAQWAGNDISYNGNTYKGPKKAADTPSLHLPTGSNYYLFVDNPAPGAATKKAYVIYFAPGVDPGNATTAQYRTYTVSATGEYSDPSIDQAITFTRAEDTPPATSEGTSSCEIDRIGWIICPVTDFLAWGMDTLYSALSGFLAVQPLQSGNNSLYRAWEVGRNLANIAFIIGFLAVIYSYITGAGLSNYNIKKMIPRLIIAAILVNISYWVCAVAVDVSNILGYSVQDLFMNLREQVVGTETNNNFDWTEISAYVLSGGAIGAVGLLAATGGSVVSGIFLLLGALVVVLFAAFVAVVILAARQALITVLIIAAPLAFVAYLLPNTEKWFEKWRQVFMTMLLLFPIFSVVFGGSQLAGAAIIQNADNLSVLILGMAVQIAPLVITPLLIKFSGGLLGQIAGMANNRSKGVVDGAKNWAKGNAELHKQKSLGTPNRKYNRANFARRSAQAMNRGRLAREGMTKNYQADAENLFNDSAKGHKLHEAHYNTDKEKQRVEKAAEDHLSKKILSDPNLLEREMKVRLTIDEAEVSAARLDTVQQELKAGRWDAFGYGPQQAPLMDIVGRNEEAARDLALTSMRKDIAKRSLDQTRADDLKANVLTIDNKPLLEYAGGILGESGQLSVLANAKKTASKYFLDDIQNIQDTLDYNVAKDNTQLHQRFTTAQTMAQRVAYANAMSQNGAPGIGELKTIITEYETNPHTSHEDLTDFKELLAGNSNIMSAGKDLEFWLTKAKDQTTNTERSFTDITSDLKTWTNLSANAFAAQNATTHHDALTLLYDNDRDAYRRVIDMVRNNPAALAQVKQGVRERFSIYSDDEVEHNSSLPTPGTKTS